MTFSSIQQARQWFEEAEEHRMEGRLRQALPCYDNIENLAPFPVVSEIWQELLVETLYAKAMLHSELGEMEEEVKTYQRLVKQFLRSPYLSVQRLVAEALINMSYTLHEHERSEQAISCLEQIIENFCDDPDERLQEYAEKATDIKLEWLRLPRA